MDQRRLNMMQLYRRQEQGRTEALEELQRMRRQEARAREEVPHSEFERMEAEKPIVEEAFQHGSLLPFLELRESQARARWEEQVAQVKERYTHAKLEADLKKAFNEQQARKHARRIQEAIFEHPDVLELLRQGRRPIRQEGNRIIVGPHVLLAMLKAAQLRRQYHDELVRTAESKTPRNPFTRLFAPLQHAPRKAA